jgi:hypothetical protein
MPALGNRPNLWKNLDDVAKQLMSLWNPNHVPDNPISVSPFSLGRGSMDVCVANEICPFASQPAAAALRAALKDHFA